MEGILFEIMSRFRRENSGLSSVTAGRVLTHCATFQALPQILREHERSFLCFIADFTVIVVDAPTHLAITLDLQE